MAKAATRGKPVGAPLLEWLAAGVGLLLVIAVIVVIGRDAVSGATDGTPDLDVVATRVVAVSSGAVLEFEIRNHSAFTAAAVQIEGKLPGGETSIATVDYVPGRSVRRGGLQFSADPRGAELRVLGYQDP